MSADAPAHGAAALRPQLKVDRGGGSVPERAADGSTSAGLGVSCFEACSTSVAAPDRGITPIGHTAAHSDSHVTAQQSMSSCSSDI